MAATSRLTLTRARAKVAEELKRATLDARRRRVAGDLFIDYGWIKLLYSGDGDVQELDYHCNQARWHDKEMHVFRSLIAPGQTVIDVGANLGFMTTIFASLVGASGRVLSFEPSPAVFEKLEKTVAANGLSQVIAKRLGCGATPGTQRLQQVNRSSGNASIIGGADGASVEIRVVPLDDVPEVWMAEVSLLKIDTEGYEPQVLQGAQRLISENKPIIYLEMGGDYLASTLQSIEFLSEAGYETAHVRSIDWNRVGNGSDYFFLPRPC